MCKCIYQLNSCKCHFCFKDLAYLRISWRNNKFVANYCIFCTNYRFAVYFCNFLDGKVTNITHSYYEIKVRKYVQNFITWGRKVDCVSSFQLLNTQVLTRSLSGLLESDHSASCNFTDRHFHWAIDCGFKLAKWWFSGQTHLFQRNNYTSKLVLLYLLYRLCAWCLNLRLLWLLCMFYSDSAFIS